MAFDNLGRAPANEQFHVDPAVFVDDLHSADPRSKNIILVCCAPSDYQKEIYREQHPLQPQAIPEWHPRAWPSQGDMLAGIVGFAARGGHTTDPDYVDVRDVRWGLVTLFGERLEESKGETQATQDWANSELQAANSPWRIKFGETDRGYTYDHYKLIVTNPSGEPVNVDNNQLRYLDVQIYSPKPNDWHLGGN